LITALVSSSFRERLGQRLDIVLGRRDFQIDWIIQDGMGVQEIREYARNSKHLILENNHDNELYLYVKYRNCLFADLSPFQGYDYLFDRRGWAEHSNIRMNTYWRQPLTKLGKRRLIEFTKERGIPYERGPKEDGFAAYIPPKSWQEAEKSVQLLKSAENLTLDRIIVDSSYPEQTLEIARSCASEMGLDFVCSRSNGFRLNKARLIISDNIESTIWGLLARIPVYSFGPSVFAGTNACKEYLGSMSFLQNTYEEADWSYADSVIYRLMTELVHINSAPEDLAVHVELAGFIADAVAERDAHEEGV
jgi:hypothetical protein